MGKNGEDKKNVGVRLPFIGIILILAGLLFLVSAIVPDFTISKLWPLFMLIPVFIFVQLLLDEGRESAGVIVPGVILLYLTIYFLWLNFTSWSNISSTWPNFILAPAAGLFCFYLAERKAGLLIPVFVLVILALIFFGGIFNSSFGIALIFIAGGILLLLGPVFKRKKD